MHEDHWIEIVAPAERQQAEERFREWERCNPAERALLDGKDIRIDLIPAVDRALFRYLIRRSSNSSAGNSPE